MLFNFSLLVSALAGLSVAQQSYPIVGVKSGVSSTNVPIRKNINDLQAAGGPQWDLYIRSLIVLQKTSPSDQLSYFQIAGIHGKPYVEWNGAGSSTSNGWQGYCPHGENLFLPWHRPYLVLYEQRLVATAIKLANGYPANVRATWLKAAQTLRAPFWDWARQVSVPTATVTKRFTITIPNGAGGTKKYTVDNPLAAYYFPKAALNGQFGTFDTGAQIYRCRSPQSYPASANAAMRARPYKSWVYDAFTSSTTFDQFASTGSTGVSLEQIHNAIHWDGACGYQFLDADFSAFDPLFMLHHANVDRLWTYWQFIRPTQAIFKSSYRGGARFNTRDGATITPDSPLQPFYRSNGQFHTSNSVTSIRQFGYTYEGLEYWRKSSDTLKKDATAMINKIYGPNSASAKVKRADDDATLTRYFAQIEVDVEQLDRPCAIGLYVNTTNVGNFIVLKQPATGQFFGKFSLDRAADPNEVADEKTSVVVDDLLSGLRIEIKNHAGEIIDLTTVPSLKVQLENADIVPPDNEEQLPEYVDSEKHTAPKKQKKQPPTA
ncbi:hypothetical protein G7Z17_g1391 [Cylindrodendrum hubeiense]|uniref:Tyrosinase copper-binding domain-containing protein n=1 Tax=Cylindrodendrum hubeiense TaxID=595255 RepID=A0A9P5HJQ1_9HYPO|nr:hypothetical protein G7Z17_g1391 [Cylindrodendrum hubeiense]